MPKPRPAAPAEAKTQLPPELGGPKGPEPTRYGDWERKGIAVRLLESASRASSLPAARRTSARPGLDMGGEFLADARHKAPASPPHNPAHCPPGRWRSDRPHRAAARFWAPGLRLASSTSLRSATDAPPGWVASQSQCRGSRVTSRAVTPSLGRPGLGASSVGRKAGIDIDHPAGLQVEDQGAGHAGWDRPRPGCRWRSGQSRKRRNSACTIFIRVKY